MYIHLSFFLLFLYSLVFLSHSLSPQNLDYFQADEESEIWRDYLGYLDDIVVDGFFNCVQCSLLYLLDNTNKSVDSMPPLLEVKLELQVSLLRGRQTERGREGGREGEGERERVYRMA